MVVKRGMTKLAGSGNREKKDASGKRALRPPGCLEGTRAFWLSLDFTKTRMFAKDMKNYKRNIELEN